MLKTLFTTKEAFLLKKNKMLILNQKETKVESISEEESKTSFIGIETRREKYLFDQTFKPTQGLESQFNSTPKEEADTMSPHRKRKSSKRRPR